ncbi:MAG TPA: hypothetical protein PLJ38_05580, partial [bacterium]|nr:hypothetical protein [bacterium]
LKYLASNVPGHLEYIKKDNVQITVVVYENNQLVSSNIRLNYGFCSDTNNISNLNNIDSVGMIVTNAETQNYYYVSGVLPVSNAGADTVVVYWFTGTDNAQGLTDEPQDLTSDGNLLTSQISGRLLLDNATAAIVYIDAISPMLQNIISPDSYSGYISGADTNVIISVVDDMYIETGNFILNYKKVGDANINSILMNYSGTPYSGQFSAVLPLSQFSNNDIIKYWVTGRDKAGNIVGAMTFISEATALALIVDTAGPQVLNFQILNAINNLEDSTYSTNTFADSIVYFYLNVADSVEIDTIYMKLYSQENNQDSTNYIVGANTIYFNVIDDTTLRTDTITFINNGNVYPVIYLSDTIGNVNIYAVAQYAGATQIYPLISKIIKINSDSTQIINIEHINNDVAIRNTELNAGDSLVITFNNSIDTSTITAFELAIVNENGATLGTITDYIWQQDFTKLIFTIPSDYAFQNYDTFGLEVFVRDLYGNYADTIASAIIDMAGPVLTNIVFVNNDTTAAYSTTITAGDSVILFFSEAMDTAILPSGAIANLQNYIKINFASVKNFGTTAYIQWIDSKTLSIGLGANVSLQDGDTLSLSYLMKDIYGNCADTDINAIYNVVIFDTAGPTIVRAYLDTVYDSTGRTINVLFSEPVKTEDLLISNFSSSLNITDVLAQIDTDKCYIRFLNIVSPGIDTIAISSSAVLSDRSILNNSATDFTPKQIIDLDSPYIKNIYVLNNDTNAGNTQISAGDTLVIVFSEPMDFRYLTKSVFMDSFSISGRTT